MFWFKSCFLKQMPVCCKEKFLISNQLACGRIKIANKLSEGRQSWIVLIRYAINIFVLEKLRSSIYSQVFHVMSGRDTHHVLIEGKKLCFVDILS